MKEQNNDNLKQVTEQLRLKDWVPIGDWYFIKGGKIYDLSTADLDQLERIENEKLFLIAE